VDFDSVVDIVKSILEKESYRIMETYTPFVGTPNYYNILHIIRNKIVGSADVALKCYNIPLY